MLLPVLLVGFLYLDTCYTGTLESISHYYYTRVNSILFLVVGFLAFFLLIYKGKEPIDFYLSVAAAIGALSLLLFPTGNVSAEFLGIKDLVVTKLSESKGREIFHYCSAGLFFYRWRQCPCSFLPVQVIHLPCEPEIRKSAT